MHLSSFQRRRARAFSVVELMITVMIVILLASIGAGGYQNYKDRVRVSQAVADIGAMSVVIKHYMVDNQSPPPSLADVGYANKLDPWGRPYYYLDLTQLQGKGKSRRDKKLNPLNSDFDLYSAGKDGMTQTQLTAHNSRDDVVRARDGKFIGLASDFDP